MKSIGIVICNFNKKEYLRQCLTSVLASDLPKEEYEVIVVDNASTDGAPQMVKEEFGQVILLENAENTGGSGGFARGMQYAINKEYEYVYLLDNDTKLYKDTLSIMLNYIKKHKKVGVVGAKICLMDCPDILQELGSFIDYDKFEVSTPLKGHKDNKANLPPSVACDYLPACCLVVTKEVLRKVSIFDVRHFIYWDDMDWCARVKKSGYEIHAIRDAKVLHAMGMKSTSNTFAQYYFSKNRILYFLKHLNHNKIEKFIDALCDEIIKITFFSYQKGAFNSAISILLGIDDLEREMLGRQDQRILIKENINLLEKLSIPKDKKPVLNIANVKLETTRRIILYLEEYFNTPISILQNSFSKNMFQEFSDMNILTSKELAHEHIVFYECEHILDAKLEDTIYDNSFIIDEYFNITQSNKIKNFIDSYETYKNIFHTIYKPALKEKLLYIKENII